MKVVAETLGVARSNLVEQVRGSAKPRGHYRRQGDVNRPGFPGGSYS